MDVFTMPEMKSLVDISAPDVSDVTPSDPTTEDVPVDSSSDESELLAPAYDEEASDSDYKFPPSSSDDSDDDYEPPSQKRRRSLAWGRSEQRSSFPQPDFTCESMEGVEPSTPQRQTQTSGSSDPDRWRNRDEEDTAPESLCFRPTNTPGPILDTTSPWTILQLFQLYFSSSVVKTIIDHTNQNAERRKLAGVKYKWDPLDIKDFYIFLAIIIYMGLCGVHEQADYWRKGFPYGHPFPGNTMPRARFEAILWSLHISDPSKDEENDSKKGTPDYDRLFKIKPLYTEIQAACMNSFQPYKNISIDERMVTSKARTGMKQYNKCKPTKWGYKLFVLADSTTGYTWNFFIYSGKKYTSSKQGMGYSSVMDLLPFDQLGSGYTLYVDNFYTSPALFLDLKEKNMGACGTVRKNLSGFPTTTENDLPKKPKRGDVRWLRKDNLLFLKWMDRRVVTMCSSVHKAFSGLTVPRNIKRQGVWSIEDVPVPDSVLEYNRNMGGVDLSDALIGYYTVHHKTKKWYKTFFNHFIDIAVVNSHILYREIEKTRNPGAKMLSQKKFREALCDQLLEYSKKCVTTVPEPPVTCMPTYYGGSTRKYCKKCFEAGEKRVKTPVHCRKCQVPLCFTSQKNCFTAWHDEEH